MRALPVQSRALIVTPFTGSFTYDDWRRSLAVTLDRAFHCNVICAAPAPANTVREVPPEFDMRKIPMGLFAEPSEVAGVVKMLCSAEGRYITGQTIHVNGGLHMAN
jgi:3-oxoacyl-[acyl-carrier protein] reductase